MKHKGLIIDLEGTILYRGAEIPGSFDVLKKLTENNIPFRVITNTVTKSVEEMAASMKSIGFDISSNYILNPIKAVNYFLDESKTSSYFFVGPSYIQSQLSIQPVFEGTPEYIILCDFEYITCSYDLFNQIYKYLLNGAKLLSTSYSDFYLSKEGPKIDTGSFTKMFEILGNQKAIIFGKPSPMLYEVALKQMGVEKKCAIAIGDDVLTDIKGAKEYGIISALVQTGKYKDGDEVQNPSDLLLQNLGEIEKYLF
ncbi:MAG: phospholysine phosphohistidine inorganic pyrophosphate phosphatase [Clostridiales bacterium]|jgi:HAD superfamily hydrolase (TIGR01458 family)|nr:phospholysine phosphohistidine inorganic pyrophosphate phosphatase [Clostridiales bacterium]